MNKGSSIESSPHEFKSGKRLLESENLFIELFENAPDAYYLADTSGNFINGNRKAEELTGYQREELIGRNFLKVGLLSIGQVIKAVALLSRNMLGQPTGPDEFMIIRKDHTKVPVEISTRVVEMQGQKLVFSIARDISERKRQDTFIKETKRLLEEQVIARTRSLVQANEVLKSEIKDRIRAETLLSDRENRLKLVFDLVPCGIMLVDAETHTIQDINRLAVDMFGAPMEACIGQECHCFICPAEKGNCPITDLNRFIDREERILVRRTGEQLKVLKSVARINLSGKEYLLESFIDITEQTRTQQELANRNEQFKLIAQTMPGVVYQFYIRDNGDRGLYYVGERAMDIFGIEAQPETAYHDFFSLLDDADKPSFLESIEQAYRGESQWNFEGRLITQIGETIWFRSMSTPFRKPGETIFNGILMNITEEKLLEADREAAQNAIRNSEAKYRLLVDHAGDVIWTMNMNWQMTYISPSTFKMHGRSPAEWYQLQLEEYVAAESLDTVITRLGLELERFKAVGMEKDRVINMEIEQIRKDGSTFWTEITVRFIFDDNGQPVGLLGITRDISQRRALQEALIRTEKMKTVAGLAAGMAHEINNPLSIIIQSTENARRRLLDDRPANRKAALSLGLPFDQILNYVQSQKIDKYLTSTQDACIRASHIVADMLQFSRQDQKRANKCNLNEIIDKSLELASKGYDLTHDYDVRKIRIQKEYSRLPDILCSETEIEQVLINIIQNAAQSMINKDFKQTSPTINIKTWSDTEAVFIEIEDNGQGMDENTRGRIFEPFFTTKEPGSGTGLGLSVVYYIIVDSHRGQINVDSKPGFGTRITLSLPLN